MPGARAFLLSFAVAAVGLAALAAAFDAEIDPYLLFDQPRRAGFNAIKPAVERREWEMKAYQARRLQARTVLIGSSRSDLGLDPARVSWPAGYAPVYNLSLIGARLDDNLKYLQSMVAANGQAVPTRVLIVGLDFESFLHRPEPADPSPGIAAPSNENDERLAVRQDGSADTTDHWRHAQDVASGLLSLDALGDSLDTVLANRRGGPQPDLEADGHLSEARFREWEDADGFATLFLQKNVQTVRQFLSPHQVLGSPGDPDGMAVVGRLLAFARGHGMRVLFFVQPTHESRLEIMDAMGYRDDYERWKRALTRCVAQARAGGQDAVLWDFDGEETYAGEPVPAAGDRRTAMHWYLDPVHYSPALGNLLLQRMLHPDDAVGLDERLTPDGLDARLARIRAARQAYRSRHPAYGQAAWKLVQDQARRK